MSHVCKSRGDNGHHHPCEEFDCLLQSLFSRKFVVIACPQNIATNLVLGFLDGEKHTFLGSPF